MDYKETKSHIDTICLHHKESVRFETISLTRYGGIVGYEVEDDQGNRYQFKSVTKNGVTKTTITNINPLTY